MPFPQTFFRRRHHPWRDLEVGQGPPSLMTAYTELSPYGLVTYEVDKKTGYLVADCPRRTSSQPPALFGFIPHTYCGRQVVACSGLLLVCLLFVIGCARHAVDPVSDPVHINAAQPQLGLPGAAGQDHLVLPLTAEALACLLASDDGEVSAVRFDDGSVVLKGGGQQLMVFLEDGGTSLQAVLPYFGPYPGDLQVIADWNAGRRFGRAYLDDEGGPVLASDLFLTEGMPAAAVRTWGQLLISMAAAFRAEVWPESGPSLAP